MPCNFPFCHQSTTWRRKDELSVLWRISIVSGFVPPGWVGASDPKTTGIGENNALGILDDLMAKSDLVQWNNDNRTEYFALVAKRIEGKDALRKKGFVVFDLDDI